MYQLEDRILFDGAAAIDVAEVAEQAEEIQQEADEAQQAAEQAQQHGDDTAAQQAPHNAADAEHSASDDVPLAADLPDVAGSASDTNVLLISDALENADDLFDSASNDTIVVRYDAQATTANELLAQINDALDGEKADTIAFAVETKDGGELTIFSDETTAYETMNDDIQQDFWDGIDDVMATDGRIDILSSNLTASVQGETLVNAIADATDHEVAASNDLTGSSALGGNWVLEDGDVDISDIYFDGAGLDSFDSVLEVDARHEVAFFNSSVMNAEEIINDLGENVEIVMLDGVGDGLEEITEYLNNANTEFDDINIFTHGNEGYFVLNGQVIDDGVVRDHFNDLASWRGALSDTADINIFGCRLAANDAGQQLVADIAAATGADIAAATDDVGGSDWTLDYQLGLVDPVALGITDYDYQLADQLVTSALDSGAGSLRLAVANVGDGQSITFDAALATSTINLSSVIDIDHSMTISGFQDVDGTNAITVSGNTVSQIFNVTGADTFAVLENLNLTAGSAVDGGAISNVGTLTLNHVTIDNSTASGNGGAIYNNGLLMLNNETIITLNNSTGAGGAIFNDGGQVLMERTELFQNSTIDDGGAIFNNGGAIQISDSYIHENTAANGAGIYNNVGSLIIQDSTFDANTATTGNGAGIYNADGQLYASNLTLSNNNTLAGDGSAIYQAGGSAETTLEHATIGLNTAATNNYAISGDLSGDWFIQNSIVTENSDVALTNLNINPLIVNIDTSIGNYIDGENGTSVFATATPQDNGGWVPTLALDTNNVTVTDSIIDASSNRGESIYDARGYMRHGARDIGAYETNAYMAMNATKGFYYTDVQTAIDNAQAGENIELFGTRYHLAAALTIDKDLILTGQGIGETVLDAAGTSRLLTIDDGDTGVDIAVRVAGMSLMNGDASSEAQNYGGAIYSAESLMLDHISIAASQANIGGAIYNNGGYLYLQRAELFSNRANYGGAILNEMGQVRVVDSTLRNNSALGAGGAIYSYDDGTGVAALTIERSAIYGNIASLGAGGAIYAEGAQKVELTNVTIAYNEATEGGAMYFDGSGTWKFTNITVAYNETYNDTADDYAIMMTDDSGLFAINTLAVGNTNGGVALQQDMNYTANANVFNSYINQDATGVFADGIMTDHGGWSYTLALAFNANVNSQGTIIGVPGYDQRGYMVASYANSRDIGAYQTNGIVAYVRNGDNANGFYSEYSTIDAAGTAWQGSSDPQSLDIHLVNTRILEANITLDMWKNTTTALESRNINLYGAVEGGTVIDAGYQGRILNARGNSYVDGTTVKYVMGALNVERLTLTGGFTANNGAAITTSRFYNGGTIALNDVTMSDNIALGRGGAIYVHAKGSGYTDQDDVKYSLNNTLLTDNIAVRSGGAIATSSASVLTLNAATVAENRSFGSGGAIALLAVGDTATGAVTANNSTISFNYASGNGGGVFNAGKLAATSSIFARNRSAADVVLNGSSERPTSGYDYYLAAKADGTALGGLTEGYGNLLEYQNGLPSKNATFFGKLDDKSVYNTTHAVLFGTTYYDAKHTISYTYNGEYLFANDMVADNGGWSGTIALDQNSEVADRGTGGDDQRHYSVNRARDIGAFELNGIVATVGNLHFTDIASAVEAAGDGDEVLLNATRILSHDVQIGNSITIKTAGTQTTYYDLAVVDAERLGRNFAIESNTLNVNMSHFIMTDGLMMVGSGTGGEQAGGVGGSIFNAGNLTLTEVSIANSVAQLSGGAIYSVGTLGINSDASLRLGANSIKSAAFISGNRAESRGGAIYATGSLTISGSLDATGTTFNHERWEMFHFNDNSAFNGGAIYGNNIANAADQYVFEAVQFKANNAVDRGGAVTLISDQALRINQSEFTLNSAMRYGGALYTETSQALTISDTNFSSHFAFSDGGALYFDGLNSSDAILTVYAAEGVGNTPGVTVDSNYSLTGDGGAFYIANAAQFNTYSETLADSMHYYFNHSFQGAGGAVFVTNSGLDHNAYAVVIGNLYDVNNYHNNLLFSYNTAVDGGALYMENSGSFFAEENVDARYNSANVDLDDPNNPGGDGGAFYIINSDNVIYRNSNVVYSNSAGNSGGGFYIENSGDINISYTKLGNNFTGYNRHFINQQWVLVPVPMSDGKGGAMFMQGNADVTLTDMDIYDNSAVEGGGVYISNDADLTEWLLANDAQGNRVYTARLMAEPAKVTVDGVALVAGQWSYDAVNHLVIVNDSPIGKTVVAVVDSSSVTINSTGFDRNLSSTRGGLYIDHAGQVDITNSSFGYNTNTALYMGYGNLNLNFTTFAYNTVGGVSGTDDAIGVYMAGDAVNASKFTLNNSIIHDGNGTDAPIRLGDNVTVTAGANGHNVLTNFYQFQGTQVGNLTDGVYQAITAYLPYGMGNSADVLDGNGNIVGVDAAAATYISNNLYLSTEMTYHANRRSRAMAIESVNSIAYRYELNGTETRSGMADSSVMYDQRGNMRSGMQVLDIHYEYNNASGEWSKVTLRTDGQIISSEVATLDEANLSGTVTKSTNSAGDTIYTYFAYTINAINPAAQGTWEQVEYNSVTDTSTAEAINAAQAISVTNFAYYSYTALNEGYDADSWSQAGAGSEYITSVTLPSAPNKVIAGGIELTQGTLGSLNENEWVMDGDHVVVRLTGDADPSTLADDYVRYIYADEASYNASDWSDAGYPNSYIATVELPTKPASVAVDGVWLQEAQLGNLQEGQWTMDGDRVIIRLAGDVDPSTLADGAVTYTMPSTWAEQIFAEDGSLLSSHIVDVSDVPNSIGAFEANFYATVTSNADHATNPYAYYGVSEWSYMDRAIDGGMTLRESIYWMDNYSIDSLGNDNEMFDAERYVKFADSMYATPGESNVIKLTANDIRPWSDVAVGMVDHYRDTYYADPITGERHYFSHDNSFRAQDDASRITVDGQDNSRLFEVRERSVAGNWTSTPTFAINNLTLQHGKVDGSQSTENRNNNDTAGMGGAIYNDGTMHLNNTVVQNSTVSNANPWNIDGNDMAYGGGIYNSGTMTISDSTVTGNLADGKYGATGANAAYGGGIYNSGDMLIERSLIGGDNQRDGDGPQGNSVVTTVSTTHGYNSATGGGIYSNGNLVMLSNTVSGNYIVAGGSSIRDGSAITIAGGNAAIYGNTIVFNDTYSTDDLRTLGYAVYLKRGRVDLQNNIIAENYIANDPAPNRRDIKVEGNNTLQDDYRNIIGKYSGDYDFIDHIAVSGDIIGKQIDPNTGWVEDLNLATELLYNGGITRNYRVETGSVAINHPALGFPSGDYSKLNDTSLYVAADGYSDGTGPLNYIADQRNLVGDAFETAGELQYRHTIGAYEMLTYATVDSDTPDEALPANGIAYDFVNVQQGWEHNLRNAVYLADQGALIEVNVVAGDTNNIFTLTEGELLIANAMTIIGINGTIDHGLIIDAQSQSRIFSISDASSADQVIVTLENMSLINGSVDIADNNGLGGAIYSTEGLVLTNITISDSLAASHGGAIYQLAGGLTLTDTTISNATSGGFGGAIFQQTDAFTANGLVITDSTAAASGGAIYVADGSSFTLDNSANTNSVLSGNSAGNDGGAIAFNGGDLTITAAYIHDNSANAGSGGGLFVNSNGNIAIDGTTFGANMAETGGGLFVNAGSMSMVNSTLSGNSSSKSGGAIYFDGSTLSLTYVTVANNIAGYQNNDGVTYQGGGVYMANGTLNMTNTIVAQNYRESIADANRADLWFAATSARGTIQYSVIGTSNWAIAGIENIIMGTPGAAWSDLGVDTELADNNGPTPTLYIYNTSVAVGNGLAIATLVDQRGEIRATGVKPDGPTIGAYEKVIHNYYFVDALADGDITNLLNWNENPVGGGINPWSFTNAVDSNFIFDNDVVTLNAGQTWTVDSRSIVYVDNGTGIVGNPDVTIAAATATEAAAIMTAYISVGGSGILNVAGTYATNSSQTIELAGQLNIAGGTITVAGAQPSADIKLTNNGLLNIATDDANVVNMTINSMSVASTVRYSLAGDQTIKTLTHAPYQNLEVAGGGTKTAATDLTVFGDLTLADNATVNSGINNLTVNGATAGVGNIVGNNVNLASTNLTGNISGTSDVTLNGIVNVTGNITGGNDVNLAGTTTMITGNIAGGNDVNLAGATTMIVGDVQAANLVNVTTATAADINGNIQAATVQFSGAGDATIRSGSVTATTITADNQLNLDRAELVAPTVTLNAPLTTVAGVAGNIRDNRIEAATLTLNGVTVNDYSTLTIDTGASDVNLNTTGVGGINVNNFNVTTNGALNFETTGNISTTVMVAPANLLGTLALTGNDIDLTGGAIFSNAEWLVLNNSGNLTLGDVNAKNLAFNGPVQLNDNATVTSGSILINGLITGNNYDLTLNANTGSVTVANADGIKDFIINAVDQAKLGNINASSLTVKAPNGIVLDGTIAVANAVELNGPIIVDGIASVTADTISSPGTGLVIDGNGGANDQLTLDATNPGAIMWVNGVGATNPLSLIIGNENSATMFTGDMNVNDLTLHGIAMIDDINIAISGDWGSDGLVMPIGGNGPDITFNGAATQQTFDAASDTIFNNFTIANPNGVRTSGAGRIEVGNDFDFGFAGTKLYLGDSGGISITNDINNMDTTRYFVTDGTGMVHLDTTGGAKALFVGSDNFYYGMKVAAGSGNDVAFRSFDEVLSNGTSGGKIIDEAKTLQGSITVDGTNAANITFPIIGATTNNPGGAQFDPATAVDYFYAGSWGDNLPTATSFTWTLANSGTNFNIFIPNGTLPGPNGALQNDRSLTIDVPFGGDITDPLNPFFNRLTREYGEYSLFNPLGEQTEGRNDGPITLSAYNPLYFGGMTGSGMPDGEVGVDIRRKFWFGVDMGAVLEDMQLDNMLPDDMLPDNLDDYMNFEDYADLNLDKVQNFKSRVDTMLDNLLA